MNTLGKTTFALAALGAAGLAPALQAQGAPVREQQHSDMMGTVGMMGGNMADMMKMMENCNRMMQSMNSRSGVNSAPSPEKKD